MIYQFNSAQLERVQRESLEKVLAVLQTENENELNVRVVEFPKKFSVLGDKGPMILVWDDEKQSYGGLTEPEPEPVAKEEPEPEVVYVRSMACDLARCIKGKDIERSLMLWNEFYSVFMKEFFG